MYLHVSLYIENRMSIDVQRGSWGFVELCRLYGMLKGMGLKGPRAHPPHTPLIKKEEP